MSTREKCSFLCSQLISELVCCKEIQDKRRSHLIGGEFSLKGHTNVVEPLAFATNLFFAAKRPHFAVVLVVRSRSILFRRLNHCRRHLCPRHHLHSNGNSYLRRHHLQFCRELQSWRTKSFDKSCRC